MKARQWRKSLLYPRHRQARSGCCPRNASGAIGELRAGQLMLITDHINLLGVTRLPAQMKTAGDRGSSIKPSLI
jgi:hypothetical protein